MERSFSVGAGSTTIARSICLGAVAIAALLSSPANAADLPRKAPPVAAPPVYSWTGFYMKGGGGYGTWSADTITIDDDGPCDLCFPIRQGGRGWFGTVGGGF